MDSTAASVLLLSIGIAISPIPITAILIVLMSDRGRQTGVGFTWGWIGGIAAVLTAAFAVAVRSDDGGTAGLQRSGAIAGIVLGAILLLVAVRQWQLRPRPGEEPTPPAWLTTIDTMSPLRAVGLGFALSGLNPKNIVASGSAGLLLGWSDLATDAVLWTAVGFTLLAGSTVLSPLVAYLVFGDRLDARLDVARAWLLRNAAVVMAVLLAGIGAALIVRGLLGR